MVAGLSGTIKFDADENEFKIALEEAGNIGEVHVRSESDACESSVKQHWWASFVSEVEDVLPLLTPLWHGFGCSECEAFELVNNSTGSSFLNVIVGRDQEGYLETDKLQGTDISSGDSFGYSLSIDGKQAIVGAVHSSSRTRTTWDFETGDLTGWSATGHAFDFQPTFGDDSRQRWVYSGFADREKCTK